MMTKISYTGYRFPPVIIQQAIWLYARFTLSFRDVEDLLAERGLAVSHETVRRWVNHFGTRIALRTLSWTSSGCCPPSNIGRSIRVEPPFDAFEARLDPVKA